MDDPYEFGSIAAANSLSDVYAMGGNPLLALNILCIPNDMPKDIIQGILQGGVDKVNEAGAVIAGGHSVRDKEPKYGLSVTGRIHPNKILSNANARPGDRLVFTKALGTGLIISAIRSEKVSEQNLHAALMSMKKLNKLSSELFLANGIQCCTDVTGFGLIGHACEIAENSSLGFRIYANTLPSLPGADELAGEQEWNGGFLRNLQAYQIDFGEKLSEKQKILAFGPETSGGLLATVPEKKLINLKKCFADHGESLVEIGEITANRVKTLL